MVFTSAFFVAVSPCFDSACSAPGSLGFASVLFDGTLMPMMTRNGILQTLNLTLPADVPTGGNLLTAVQTAFIEVSPVFFVHRREWNGDMI